MYSALADPTRRNIIELLAASGQMSASDIYSQFSSTPPAISQHLKILYQAKLVKVERQAQRRIYAVNIDTLNEVDNWIKQINMLWAERFDRLDQLLIDERKKYK